MLLGFNMLLWASQITDEHFPLLAKIKAVLPDNAFAKKQMERLSATSEAAPDASEPYSLSDDGLLLCNGLIYVPDSNNLHLEVLVQFHDHKTTGHPGTRRTMKLIQHRFFWPKMHPTVTCFVRSCLACA